MKTEESEMALVEPDGRRDDPEHVEIKVNNHTVKVPEEVTGAQIKELAHQDPALELFQIRGDDEILIENHELIHVHRGEEFVACPGLEPA
jgi:hypothetical protein